MKEVPVGINNIGKVRFLVKQAEVKSWGEAYKTALLIYLEKKKIVETHSRSKPSLILWIEKIFSRQDKPEDFLFSVQMKDAIAEMEAAASEMKRLENMVEGMPIDYDQVQSESQKALANQLAINTAIPMFSAMSGLPEASVRALYDAYSLDEEAVVQYFNHFNETIQKLDGMAKTISLPQATQNNGKEIEGVRL